MKILILRFSSIGDIVLCTPIIRACKKQLNAEVHFLTKSKYKNVLEANPNVDNLILFDKNIEEVKSRLIENNYDVILDLHNNLRSFYIKKWLKKPFGKFPKLNIQKWILVNTKINRLPNIHIVDRYFQAAEGLLKIKNDNDGLDYFIPENQNVNLDLLLETKNITGHYACLVLGATYQTKKIPKFLAIEIIHKSPLPVILIGGPEEFDVGNEISMECKNVINACGKYKLNQSASIIEQSSLVITGDTGMMHIASAFKKPIIMIWGNTVPEFGMGPYLTQAYHFEVENLKCRPCSKIGYHECPKKHFKCMHNQNVDLINQKMNALIQQIPSI